MSKEETITESKKAPLSITPEEVFKWISVIQGKDPDAIQAMSKFMNVESNDERSYFPTQLTALAIAQLRMYGKAHYPNESWNEYELMADLISIGFMGYKGFKSEQYKDITSGQPNLDKLQGLTEETRKSVLSSIFS